MEKVGDCPAWGDWGFILDIWGHVGRLHVFRDISCRHTQVSLQHHGWNGGA
jgi:hypothetical protein